MDFTKVTCSFHKLFVKSFQGLQTLVLYNPLLLQGFLKLPNYGLTRRQRLKFKFIVKRVETMSIVYIDPEHTSNDQPDPPIRSRPTQGSTLEQHSHWIIWSNQFFKFCLVLLSWCTWVEEAHKEKVFYQYTFLKVPNRDCMLLFCKKHFLPFML